MSRIDKALELWEQERTTPSKAPAPASPVAAADAAPSGERFTLSSYEHETSAATTTPAQVTAPAQAAPQPERRVRPPFEEVQEAPSQPIRRRTKIDPERRARLVSEASGGVPLEQYRRLAAVLHDIQMKQGLKTLMITSAVPAEGKTLTVVNLALTLSESYARRVLIIDADLRWPSVHKLLDVPNGVGLSEALKGQQFDLPIHDVSERLAVLTAGRPGQAPLAGLTSTRMEALVDECAAHFDWVLIDTPPVGLMPDAQLLARLTRAVVLVIAAGSTPSATVERAVSELGPDCIIGTVLNRVDARSIPQADYYAYYEKDDASTE